MLKSHDPHVPALIPSINCQYSDHGPYTKSPNISQFQYEPCRRNSIPNSRVPYNFRPTVQQLPQPRVPFLMIVRDKKPPQSTKPRDLVSPGNRIGNYVSPICMESDDRRKFLQKLAGLKRIPCRSCTLSRDERRSSRREMLRENERHRERGR